VPACAARELASAPGHELQAHRTCRCWPCVSLHSAENGAPVGACFAALAGLAAKDPGGSVRPRTAIGPISREGRTRADLVSLRRRPAANLRREKISRSHESSFFDGKEAIGLYVKGGEQTHVALDLKYGWWSNLSGSECGFVTWRSEGREGSAWDVGEILHFRGGARDATSRCCRWST